MSITRRSLVTAAAALAVVVALPPRDGLTAEERRFLALLPAHVRRDPVARAVFLGGLRDPDPIMRRAIRKLILLPREQQRRLLAWMEAHPETFEAGGRNPS